MSHEHDFLVLHFGAQCPWYLWVIEQARKTAVRLKAGISVKDVMKYPEYAERYRMFFPFMTVIDGKTRVSSPLAAEELQKIALELPSGEATRPVKYGTGSNDTVINSLTPDLVDTTIPLCMAGVRPIADRQKANWASELAGSFGLSEMGYLALREDKPVAVAEYLPATVVPYPLPRKDASIAFITCLYPTGKDHDYRAAVLERLLHRLPGQGYSEVQVIAGRRTPYPNGPVDYFRQYGFVEMHDVGTVCVSDGREDLVLMSRTF